MSNFLYKLNPLYKCVAVLAVAVIFSFTNSVMINLAVFGISMLAIVLGSKKFLRGLFILLPLVPVGVGFLVTGLYFGTGNENAGMISVASFETGLQLATRIFAFAGLGLVFSLTTNPTDFVKALHRQAGLPRKFAYGLLCALNILPYLKREYENSRLAIEIRGEKLHPLSLKPVFATLVNSIRWSETLSMAMKSKGFED